MKYCMWIFIARTVSNLPCKLYSSPLLPTLSHFLYFLFSLQHLKVWYRWSFITWHKIYKITNNPYIKYIYFTGKPLHICCTSGWTFSVHWAWIEFQLSVSEEMFDNYERVHVLKNFSNYTDFISFKYINISSIKLFRLLGLCPKNLYMYQTKDTTFKLYFW
jgi:hypothetical protein